MSNASVTCNQAYSLVSSPPWSNICDIELILSDIPFISVGMLAFGVSAFFLAVRRFTFSIVSLYFSVLLSFTAVIIDLTQILIRDLSHVTVWPLVTTREILLALSLSLRFIFYWLYVTEPPVEDQPPHSFQAERVNFLSLNPQDELHSGSWARWGVAGSYAKFASLATIPAITVLQIIWRVFQRYHDYNPVYAVDVTLEVIVSVLLLFKLLLNIVPTSSIPQAHTFRECGFPTLALIINIGISIGGLVSFAFTESIVGRLLQGVELYILIVFMTIYPFFRHKKVPTVPNTRDVTMKKVELPEQLRASTFCLSPPVVSTPRLSTALSSEIQGRNVNADAARHSALDSIGRAPPWVPWRVSRIQSNQDEDRTKLWDQGEAETGPPDAGQGSVGHQSMVSVASVVDKESTSWRDIVNDSVPYSLRTATPDSLSVSTGSRDGSLNSEHIWDAIRVGIPTQLRLQPPSLVAIPATTTNGSEAAVIMAAPPDPPSQDSPICESNGVTSRSPGRKRSSGTSLDQFRELQSELDRTIAALRQFSPSSPISPTSTSSPRSDSNDDEKIPSAVRQSSSTGRQSFSTYGVRTLSDFSLSNFPSPPSSPQVPSLLPLYNPRLREDRRARLGSCQDTSSDILTLTPPPRIPAALTDVPSSPHSDLTSDSPYQGNVALPTAAGRPSRFNSGGTQYEITSFIDGLTTPDGSRGPMSNMSSDGFGENYPLSFIIEDSNSQEASPSLSIATLRPSPLRATALTGLPPSSTRHRLSVLSIQERLSPVSKSEEQPSDPNPDSVEPAVQRGIRPLILPSMTITSPFSHSRSSSISSGAGRSRRMFGLPPRPDFRVAKPLPEDVQTSGAFRRPKPPALILLSDDEYFAKHSE